MKATQTLHDQGQRLWLDNITRDRFQERHPAQGELSVMRVW